MSALAQEARSPGGGLAFSENRPNVLMTILKLVGLMLLDGMGIIIIYSFLWDGNIGMAAVFTVITVMVNLIIFVPGLSPLRWMAPGLVLITLLVIYPVILTIITAFTNYGDGHLFTKEQAVNLIRERGYVPENASTFTYIPYTAGDDSYALWLTDEATGEVFFIQEGTLLEPVDIASFGVSTASTAGFTEFDPSSYGQFVGFRSANSEIEFGEPLGTIPITTNLDNVEGDSRFVILERAPNVTVYDREADAAVEGSVLFREGDDGLEIALDFEADGTSFLALPGQPVIIDNAPTIDGFSPTDPNALIEAGIETLEFPDPLGVVEIQALDPIVDGVVTPQWVFDYEQGLTVNRNDGVIYDTTVFQNPAGEYAFWLTRSGGGDLISGELILPGARQNPETFDFDERNRLRDRDIDLPTGASIPESIGAFERVSASEAISGLEVEGVRGGFIAQEVDFTDEYVFDPAQGLAVDFRTGDVFPTSVYVSEDGENFALWLNRGRNLAGRINTVVARTDGTTILNGAPLEYEGYRQLSVTSPDRAAAIIFLDNIDVDYFGEEGQLDTERIGIIDGSRAGQPFLLRYVWNENEEAFLDLSSIDAQALGSIEELGLETVDPFTVEGLATATYFVGNGETGIFEPKSLQFVFNDTMDAYIRLDTATVADPTTVSAEALTTLSEVEIAALGTTLYTEYEDQGVFAPVTYAYDRATDTFTDSDTGNRFEEDAETGFYVPEGWVYNETDRLFADLSGVELGDLNLNGVDLQVMDPEVLSNLTPDALTLYDEYTSQGVFAPQYVPNNADGEFDPDGFVFNSSLNAFVDMGSIASRFHEEIADLDVTTADLTGIEAFENADIYRLDSETGIYTTDQYVFNATLDGYVDTSDLPDNLPESVDIAADDLFEIEGLETLQLVSADSLKEPLLYAEDVDPVFNETLGAFIVPANANYDGFDLTTIDPVSIEAISSVPTIPASASSVSTRTNLVFSETTVASIADETRYILGSSDGTLDPGYRVNIGLGNFQRLLEDSELLTPLINIFVWTVTFALLSVLTTFAVGLFMAIILNDDAIPGKKVIRSLLIIPYAIPGVIGILVWQGMLNENIGIVTNAIAEVFGVRVLWFSDPTLAKVAIIIVNLWLGYPYMMLICSGALSAIPSDVYEAAAVDGARPMQRFWAITLPLLLVTVGPLLIASFAYNFNNYLMIELLTEGNPPIPGTPTPAGYTDILISYTYNLAFGNSRGADFGYASAITIVIFGLVAIVTMFQYRFTRTWEEVGENV